ncbi:MAG: hypothetical protein ACPG19_11690 [Saprospiraceae bacterium]
MKHLILLISLFFTTLLLGQATTPDSIASRIIQDTEKLNALYKLVQGFSADEQAFKVIEYGQPTIALAQNLDDKEKVIQTNFALAKAYTQQRLFQEAIRAYNSALSAVTDSAKSVNILKKIYLEKGIAHLEVKEYYLAKQSLQKAFVIFKKKRDRRNIALTETYIADAFLGMDDTERAIVYLKRAERSYDKAKKIPLVVETMVKTGMVYLQAGDDNLALNQFKKAIERAERFGNEHAVGIAKKYLGYFYYQKGFYKESYKWQFDALVHFDTVKDTLEYGRMLSETGLTLNQTDSVNGGFQNELQALALFRQLNSQKDIAKSLNNLGKHYVAVIGKEQAAAYLQEAIEVNKMNNQFEQSIDCFLNLAYIFFQQKKYKKVVFNANSALNISESTGNQDGMQKAALLLTRAYNETKQYKKALASQQLFDSLYISMSQTRVETLKDKTKKTKDDYHEVLTEKKSFSIYKYLFWILLPLFIASLSLFYIFFKKVNNMPVGTRFYHKKENKNTKSNPIKDEKTTENDAPTSNNTSTQSTPQISNQQAIEAKLGLLKSMQIAQIAGLSNETSLIHYKINEAKLQAFNIINNTLEQTSEESKFDFASFMTSFQNHLSNNNLNHHSQIQYQANDLKSTDLEHIVSIALLVPEVITSIAAYGFENQLIGKIEISNASKKSSWTIKIAYNGTSPTGTISQQFSTCIKAMNILAKELGVDLEYQSKDEKTVFSIEFGKNHSFTQKVNSTI